MKATQVAVATSCETAAVHHTSGGSVAREHRKPHIISLSLQLGTQFRIASRSSLLFLISFDPTFLSHSCVRRVVQQSQSLVKHDFSFLCRHEKKLGSDKRDNVALLWLEIDAIARGGVGAVLPLHVLTDASMKILPESPLSGIVRPTPTPMPSAPTLVLSTSAIVLEPTMPLFTLPERSPTSTFNKQRLSCLCFASDFLPTLHYCDAVAFGYLIPLCQRLFGDFHPSYMSCLTYRKKTAGTETRRENIGWGEKRSGLIRAGIIRISGGVLTFIVGR